MTYNAKNRIREIRQAKKMTLQQVADRTNLTTDPAQIQKLEKGLRSLTPKWLSALSRALDVAPYELLPQEWQSKQPLSFSSDVNLIKIPLIASVQEKVWQQNNNSPLGKALQDSAQAAKRYIFTNKPSTYSEKDLFCVEVTDNSLSTLYPKGTLIVCVKRDAFGPIENGKRVVCVKSNPQMNAAQWLIRRYTRTDKEELLFNDIPGHLEVDTVKEGDVDIIGVIIKSIRDE